MASAAPIVAMTGGVGSGKTVSGVLRARYKIAQLQPGAIVAPDFPHFARSTWPVMEQWLPMAYCVNADLNHPYTKEQMLRFKIGKQEVKVWYGSMENVEAWTGMNLNWFFFDEVKRERTRRAFDVLVSRLRVGKWPQGFISSTPLGMNHWLYDICVKDDFPEEVIEVFREAGYTGKIVDWIRCKTSDNEKNLPKTYIAMLKALYTGKLALQELEGEFIPMEGAVWSEFSNTPGSGNVTEDAEYNDSVDVEWWVDDGFVEKHPRVILFAQEIPPYVNIFDEYIIEGEYPEDSIKACLKKPYRKPSLALIDSSAAVLRSKLWDVDIDTVKATHDVEQGVLHVGPFIKDGDGVRHLRVHPRCERTIRGIMNYARDDETHKLAKLGDDVADAVRYGLWNKSVPQLKDDAEHKSVSQERQTAKHDSRVDWQRMSMEQQMLYRWETQYRQN